MQAIRETELLTAPNQGNTPQKTVDIPTKTMATLAANVKCQIDEDDKSGTPIFPRWFDHHW
jgi:hypothetical protein